MQAGVNVLLEEYLSSMYDPDCEWVDGEVIERNMGESDHSTLQMAVAALLYAHRREAGIHVYPELRLQTGRDRFRIPDILVTTGKVKGRILREPPFLCIEIVSPEDRISRMEAKIAEYLQFGVRYVWLIDPRERKAWAYSADGRVEVRDGLTTSSPDLEVRLDELFAALDEEVDPE